MITSKKHNIQEYITHKVKVDVKTMCWEWQGKKDKDGYGKACFKSKQQRAHRLVYEVFHGQISKNLLVLHKCDNRCCVNPAHLFLGTHLDNMKDKNLKGKQHRGEQLPWTKLKEKDIIKIRKLRKDLSLKTIAKLYNISIANVSDICNYNIWKHI